MKQDLYEKIVDYILGNQTKFYRLAFSYVHNREDALDIVQSSVCKALEHYGMLRDENAVRTWFYRILVNESIQLIKKQKKEVPTENGEIPEDVYYEKDYEPEEDISREIDRLDVDGQTIIKLRFFEELSLKEISLITGINENTVKAKLYRGLKRLKQNIQEVEVWAD